jgi:streptogramin lyase
LRRFRRICEGEDARVRTLAIAVAALAVATPVVTAGAAGSAPLPGARSFKVCAAAGPFWPTMTLVLDASSAWIACKEQARVIRVSTRTGKTLRSVRLGSPVIAVTSGLGSVWALGSSETLHRLSPASGKLLKRIALRTSAAYNVWIGAGSVWVADDQGAQVVRVSPRTNRVTGRFRVGDGPADMAFDGGTAWVINHRDRVLSRIDLSAGTSSQLAVIAGDAPERMVWSRGSLWITGRGTDLLQVNPTDGSLVRTIEIGASGIDVAAAGNDLWVPTRSAAVDATGFPTMDALQRVSISSGAVTTAARPTGRLDVHGLATRDGAVWLADNRNGRLYRLAA